MPHIKAMDSKHLLHWFPENEVRLLGYFNEGVSVPWLFTEARTKGLLDMQATL